MKSSARTLLLFLLIMENQFIYGQTDILSVIHSRKSVRLYTEQKLSDEQLEALVRAGMAAPSAMNKQPWVFVVINSREVLDSLSEALGENAILKRAPAAIVVCGNLNKAIEDLPDYWVQDCSAASENILLAAEGTGLGAVWIGIYPRPERVQPVQKVLQLPDYIIPLNIISVGYPTGAEKPKDKWKPENVKLNKWY